MLLRGASAIGEAFALLASNCEHHYCVRTVRDCPRARTAVAPAALQKVETALAAIAQEQPDPAALKRVRRCSKRASRWHPSHSKTSASAQPGRSSGSCTRVAAAAAARTAQRVLGERATRTPLTTTTRPSRSPRGSVRRALENAKANTACEACGAVRAPTPRERRMSRERAPPRPKRDEIPRALRDEAAADPVGSERRRRCHRRRGGGRRRGGACARGGRCCWLYLLSSRGARWNFCLGTSTSATTASRATRRSCSPSASAAASRARRWRTVHTACDSVPSALRVWSSARREDNATSRGTLRACLACATRATATGVICPGAGAGLVMRRRRRCWRLRGHHPNQA